MKRNGYLIVLIYILLIQPMTSSMIRQDSIDDRIPIVFIYPRGSTIIEQLAIYVGSFLEDLGVKTIVRGYIKSEYLDMLSNNNWDITLNIFQESSIVPDFSIYDQSTILGNLFYNHKQNAVQELITQSKKGSIFDFDDILGGLENLYGDTWLPDMNLLHVPDFIVSNNLNISKQNQTRDQYFKIRDRLRLLFYNNNNSNLLESHIVMNSWGIGFDQLQFDFSNTNFLTSSVLFLDLFNGTYNYENALTYNKFILDTNKSIVRHIIDVNPLLNYSSGDSIDIDDYLFTIELYKLNVLRNYIKSPDFISRILDTSINNNFLTIDVNDSRIDDSYNIGQLFPTPRNLLGGVLTIDNPAGDILFTALSDTFNPLDSNEWNEYEAGDKTSGQYALNNTVIIPPNPFLFNYEKSIYTKLVDRNTISSPGIVIRNDIDIDSLIELVKVDQFIPNLLFLSDLEYLETLISKSFDIYPISSSRSPYKLIFNQDADVSIRHAIPYLINSTTMLPLVSMYATTQNSLVSPKYTKWHNTNNQFQIDQDKGILILSESGYISDSNNQSNERTSIPTITETDTRQVIMKYHFTILLVFFLSILSKKNIIRRQVYHDKGCK
ncbi:MAG: hypothetical protein HeimC2_28580 [Candidatus Heimdallarchaeota archaeon LC_2]|nr:MAG: hypothetical protein HeimC2_28580 [Candidatus Heimdallarchaeota archaeon LC_2]